MWPRTILMVTPKGYRIEYAINPHMADSAGRLHRVDEARALEQWRNIQNTYQRLGLDVEILEGDPAQPDMVFCANQTFPFINEDGERSILLGRMSSEQRQGEVKHFR